MMAMMANGEMASRYEVVKEEWMRTYEALFGWVFVED
jgi:hypothetical protein